MMPDYYDNGHFTTPVGLGYIRLLVDNPDYLMKPNPDCRDGRSHEQEKQEDVRWTQ
ncbi:MAG: hypothetical protein WD750_10550 [Gammaproteobacteria bacterium]